MPTTLNTDPALMMRIKKTQYRHQIPALALLAIAFFLSFFVTIFNMRYPSLVLSVIAIAWFMYVNASFRFKQKIPIPNPDSLLSPITGRVKSLKRSSDFYQLNISKSPIDLVEIRCPHDSSQWDGNNLKVTYKGVNLTFRFEANELQRFEDVPMQTGNIIGLFIGGGNCFLNLPASAPTILKTKHLCEGGITEILAG